VALTTHPNLEPKFKKGQTYTSNPSLGLRGLLLGDLYLYLYRDGLPVTVLTNGSDQLLVSLTALLTASEALSKRCQMKPKWTAKARLCAPSHGNVAVIVRRVLQLLWHTTRIGVTVPIIVPGKALLCESCINLGREVATSHAYCGNERLTFGANIGAKDEGRGTGGGGRYVELCGVK
jgi:hypothetical protein